MKLFGKRNKPEPPRRTLVLGHCYDDQALDAARAGLGDGDLRAALTVLTECRDEPEVRSLRLSHLTGDLVGAAEELGTIAREQDTPELWLLVGETFLDEAQAIRGTGYANTVSEERFKLMHRTAAKALGALHRAAELLPDDPTPWASLMSAGLLLGADREEHDAVWREVIQRCPTHYRGHAIRLQTLAPKWGGTEDEMLQFAAAGTFTTAEPGSALAVLEVMGTFEVYLQARREVDAGQHDFFAAEYFAHERLLPRLVAASDRWLGDERPHPRSLQAHHYFAAAFSIAGQADRAFLHLLGTRDRFSSRPWAYIDGSDPERVFHQMVAKYWPPDVLPESPMSLAPDFPMIRD